MFRIFISVLRTLMTVCRVDTLLVPGRPQSASQTFRHADLPPPMDAAAAAPETTTRLKLATMATTGTTQ